MNSLKSASFRAFAGLKVLGIAAIGIAGLLLGLRQLGILEPLELAVYDQMVRLRPDLGVDPRLLIVEITEEDIRSQKRWPISDRAIAQALKNLQRYQPKAIGVDLIRDIPNEPGHGEFLKQLKRPNVISIQFLSDTLADSALPPAEVPKEQIGFSNVVTDLDGVVRRNLMFAQDDGNAGTLTSFATRLALVYLHTQGSETTANEFKLANTVFKPLKANSGGYQTIDASGYQILLNYRTASNPAEVVTLTQVLRGDIQPQQVQDRIVILGVTAPSLKDLFFTPYSTANPVNPKIPGVWVQAQMVSQILTAAADGRSLVWFWPERLEILWIISWAMIGGGIAWSVSRPLLLLLVGSGLLLLLVGLGYAFFLQQGWIPIATPLLAAIATGGFTIAYQMYDARQQQQIVMKLLGQQTSPEIASALWTARDRLLQSGILAGQNLIVTVLFIDIRNFSSISEQHPPERVMSWLNEYMGTMTQAVHVCHGIVNKFMGDGLMAVFGVPVPRSTPAEIAEDARQAVVCALMMGDRLQELNQDWQQRDLPVVQMRAGIFTGPVMAGSLGSKNRLEYAIIGDSVNIASRLEGCEKDRQTTLCRILIARETLDFLQDQFAVESWGKLQLRGHQRLVEVYQVLGYAQSSPDIGELSTIAHTLPAGRSTMTEDNVS